MGEVQIIIDEVAPYTDILERHTLEQYLGVFEMAHAAAPGGISLEVGTRAGGTALLFLKSLERMYEKPPLLVTVDPYGEKPWSVGVIDPLNYKYGDEHYLTAKKLLAPYANHIHFNLLSEDFWRLEGVPVWRAGTSTSLTDLTFAFLDGDHSPYAVMVDAIHVVKNLRKGGLLLIDNVDWTLRDISGTVAALAPMVARDKRWAAFQK